MAEADLTDVIERAQKDSDVAVFLRLLKRLLPKYGAWYVMRMVAYVLAPIKRANFEQKLHVRESRTLKFSSAPSALANKEIDTHRFRHDMGLDHSILWQQRGKLLYLTAEPYYINKDTLKNLIAHCDEHDIDFQIDAESCYYPGHTVRILFKRGYVSMYDAMQQMSGERRG